MAPIDRRAVFEGVKSAVVPKHSPMMASLSSSRPMIATVALTESLCTASAAGRYFSLCAFCRASVMRPLPRHDSHAVSQASCPLPPQRVQVRVCPLALVLCPAPPQAAQGTWPPPRHVTHRPLPLHRGHSMALLSRLLCTCSARIGWFDLFALRAARYLLRAKSGVRLF